MNALCENTTKELEISRDKMCVLSQDLKVWFNELNIEFKSSAISLLLDLSYLFILSE